MNTLRGIFPDPKPVYKRNFIQENMKQLKHMQGIYNKVEVAKPPLKSEKYQNIPAKVTQYMTHSKSVTFNRPVLKKQQPPPPLSQPQKKSKRPTNISRSDDDIPPPLTEPDTAISDVMDSKYRDTGCQTDADKAKEGVLKLPSKHLISKSMNASGDYQHKNEATEKKLSNMSIGDKNKRTSRPTTGKGLSPKPSGTRPDSFKSYQRGVVPKYIREKHKEAEPITIPDPDCPPGHVTIPDAERKETLRALRQSYADLIAELNLLPVKTDTLRTRNRKIELEKQLDKIEDGIKVFSRPKVYVKIDS